MYTVVKDFMISHSPVSYYTEGRVIDLALLSNPSQGVIALSEVVDLYFENGSIDNKGIAFSLKSQLNEVYLYLQSGEYDEALGSLKAFKNHIKAQLGKHIFFESAQKLIYLANNLEESILSSPIAARASKTDKGGSKDFQLLQNYPNPFNPQTEIAYTLPEDSHVKLAIYNTLGQEVKVLVDEYQNAGKRKVIWDGLNENGEKVASGIYFYKLDAGGSVQTKKMSLIK